ncbi:D-alanine--D-alanine ligase [Azospirillum halopraeferens]|uniref:D-alanine--D-alanine ligase n=1 Tax=Azospirillum halopraeferens TaxID=34010 RepID=UPI0003F69848|nr:D-alanine--D-alanine ligase [Azospirillum halopraeferens]
MADRTRVAVIFGGCSPEHDVSVVSGLQALRALDGERFEGFPVYIAADGEWLAGKELAERATYIPDAATRAKLQRVSVPVTPPGGRPVLRPAGGGLLSRPRDIPFDVALPVLHGGGGEDGRLQGFLDVVGVPYTGMRPMASAVLMDKIATKRLLASAGIPLLPFVELKRPGTGLLLPRAVLAEAVERIGLPCIVKPVHLGSSIGVARITAVEELEAVLPAIFRLDSAAMLEPFVPNLVEYNVSVCALGGRLRTSAIERPKRAEELLDFKQKYLSGGGKGGGGKTPGAAASEGMLSLTRDINPDLPGNLETRIRDAATAAFTLLGGSGAPRIDFLSNGETGEVWLNEANPCPGSLGYFLWEAAEEPILFTQLLTLLVEEAVTLQQAAQLPADPVPSDARLFRRP